VTTTNPGGAGKRALRRDAELNLSRILSAAREVFAAEGYDASMEHIAERAQVGIGTLYRRFPSKAELFNEVAELNRKQFHRITEDVRGLVEPNRALFEFMERVIENPGPWRATMARAPWGEASNAFFRLLAPLLQQMIDEGQRAGSVRDGIEIADVVMALVAARRIADLFDPVAPESSRRFLAVVIDGLRPACHTAQVPPPYRPASLKDITEIVKKTPGGAKSSGPRPRA
jgi:AcrR family transcriptional regulator